MKLVFLDTETTGFEKGRIIQLAYKIGGEKDTFVEYYKPPVPIEIEAMSVHHITEKKVADKKPFAETETYKKLPALFKEAIFVAHNAKFDISVLATEGIKIGEHICTYKLALSEYDLPRHNLQYLRYLWGIDIETASAHDAEGDVLVLEEVFDHMLADYMKKHGVGEEEAIKKFIEISKNPILLKKLSFGKYAGMTFDDIRASDFSYLQWLGTLKDKDEDFTFTVSYHLTKKPSATADDLPF